VKEPSCPSSFSLHLMSGRLAVQSPGRRSLAAAGLGRLAGRPPINCDQQE